MYFSFGMVFLFHYFLLSQESIGIVGHIVARGWHVSESIFKELASSANRTEMVPVSSAQVVECPLDLVNKDMEIKVLKNKEDDIHGYQAINMRNPISRLSISGDEGKTWTGLSHEKRSAAFLHPAGFKASLNVTIRVESWIGGTNVQINMGSAPSQESTLAKGNNVCRSKTNFLSTTILVTFCFFFRQLQAHWDSLDRMERMHGNLCWRDKAALETGRQVEVVAVVHVAGSCHQGQWELLHEGERHD